MESAPVGVVTQPLAKDVEPETTVGDWLTALQPPPPPALFARLSTVLAAYVDLPQSQVPESCLAAGEQLLDELLASGSTSRGSALDLLAVDALVTYAFESAADAPSLLEARAARAMSRLAALPGDRPD
jgi:hypothetical protein